MRAIGTLVPREVQELAGAQRRLIEKAIEEDVLPVYRSETRGAVRHARRVRGEADRKHRATRRRRLSRSVRQGRRMLPTAAVPYAALMTKLTQLKLELSKGNKKALFQKLASLNPGEISKARLEVVPAVEVDVGRLVGDVMDRTERYLRSRREWVTSDESILGGTPVIRGTRITVYSLLGRLEHGETIEEILKDNPDLPREAVEAAVIFAGAHPLRGRPSGRPWVRRA